MTWTAYIEEIIQRDAAVIVRATLTDGIQKVRRQYDFVNVDDAALKSAMISDSQTLDAVAVSKSALTIAVGDAVDLTPPVPPKPVVPTVQEQAAADFRTDYRQLQALQRGVAAGLISAADKRIADLLAILQPQVETYIGSL